jgi:hypothetical protein
MQKMINLETQGSEFLTPLEAKILIKVISEGFMPEYCKKVAENLNHAA